MKEDLAKYFFDFLDQKEERKIPFRFKLLYFPEKITKDDLSVGGNLNLEETRITSLPEGLSVGGNLNLRRTPITSLPKDLLVKGKIYHK